MMFQGAPGLVSVTADGWTVDTTKAAILGVTAHWIEVKEGKWMVRAEVIGFCSISGDHSSENLGQYLVGVFDRVGIMSKNHSKVCDDIELVTCTVFVLPADTGSVVTHYF